MRSTWVLPLVALALACTARGGATPSAAEPRYDYVVTPPAAGSWTVHVAAHFEAAPSEWLVAPSAGEALTHLVQMGGSAAGPVPRAVGAWPAPSCRTSCNLAYDVDLDAVASACDGIGCERRVGDAVLGSAATWMLLPQPSGDARIHVRVEGPNAGRLATGLRPAEGGGYAVRARELGEAPFTAVGDFRRAQVDVGGTPLQLVLMGAPLAMGDSGASRWVADAAGCVAGLFGRFPVPASVFVVPVRGAHHVVFGRVMSLAGASVVLLVGSATEPSRLHDDWVTVHELFHLGTPSFVGEGHWLEEGLATYYEPVLRERAGWMRPADLWTHFAKQMPRGVRKPGSPPSIEDRDDIDSTYWGGALFALLADVRIRTATHGARSLDTALRAALATLGDATHAATVADFLRVGDEATGTHVLADTYAHEAIAGAPIDLDELWRSLGVEAGADRKVVLRDGPLMTVRDALASGSPR